MTCETKSPSWSMDEPVSMWECSRRNTTSIVSQPMSVLSRVTHLWGVVVVVVGFVVVVVDVVVVVVVDVVDDVVVVDVVVGDVVVMI